MDRDTGPICIEDTLPNILDTGVKRRTLVCATHFVLHQTHVAQHHTHVAQHHTHQRTMLNSSTLNARSQRGFMHCKYLNITQALLQIITRLLVYQIIFVLLLIDERTNAMISPPALPDQISTSVRCY
jgi:hypothetical protein